MHTNHPFSLPSLIGYIRPINADELEKYKGEGYSSTSMLGITGLEQEYEKRLREDKGGVIYISKQENGKEIEKIEIARKESKNGEDIKLSIDFDLQKKIYEQMNKDLGASTAINPKNGEILAMVSSPSFDSNLYTTYIPESVREIWKNNSNPNLIDSSTKSFFPISIAFMAKYILSEYTNASFKLIGCFVSVTLVTLYSPQDSLGCHLLPFMSIDSLGFIILFSNPIIAVISLKVDPGEYTLLNLFSNC